jgi:glycosyltransferase involved in cell wall biosynthesis
MPPRDRVELLVEAIESVQAQRHTRWELLVVDDGSVDGTADVLAGLDDPRVRALSADGRGCSAARNVALDVAHGDVITYLDDDNRFHPDWLVAVSWMFTALPDVRVAYGARVIEDEARVLEDGARARPVVQLHKWDREAIERMNTLDMNVLAHRPSPIRFDERIRYFGDWDLVLRLSEDTEPLPIPVIAAFYSTSAAGRLSDVLPQDAKVAEAELVREGVATRSRARRRSG